MDKIFDSLINIWCWILIAAAGLILGAAFGGLLYYFVGGVFGQALWLLGALLGLFLGMLWANSIANRGQLVEHAGGVHVPQGRTEEASPPAEAGEPPAGP